MIRIYNHTKLDLATVVARNWSKHSKEIIWVYTGGIKSVQSMKYCDSTVILVCTHSELPIITTTSIITSCWYKGKQRTIE